MLLRNERKLPFGLHKLYVDLMTEYEELGHMRKLSNVEISEPSTISHRAVINPSSTTTKCHVVFNASTVDDSGTSQN